MSTLNVDEAMRKAFDDIYYVRWAEYDDREGLVLFSEYIAPVIAAKDAELMALEAHLTEVETQRFEYLTDRDEWKRRAEAAEDRITELDDLGVIDMHTRIASLEAQLAAAPKQTPEQFRRTVRAARLVAENAAREKGGLAAPYTEGEIPGGIKGAILHATRPKDRQE